MSTESMSEFLQRLHASRLLDLEHIDELVRRPEPPEGDVEGVERFLEGKGWLTRFQIDEIRAGRGDRLSFNGYRLVEKLADPPSGTIYKATHPALRDAVSFQWLDPAWLEPADRIGDYLQRTQSVSSISHPHLLNVLDAGQVHGKLFVVRECVDSTDLGRLVGEMGAVPVPLACEYTRQAALGLQAIHERGIAHGDFSPFRMLLFPVIRKVRANGGPQSASVRPGPGASLKVAEAGQIPLRPAAREIPAHETARLGAIEYMAPERADRSDLDPRQDVYSLGASLYYLLAGRPPLQVSQASDTLVELLNGEPARIETFRADVPPPLADLVHRMLAKDPRQRPENAGVAAIALQPYCSFAPAAVKSSAIPVAEETISGPAPVHEHLPIAEELPGLEPLPTSVTDSQVYSPRRPAAQAEYEVEVEHHDPFGDSDEEGPSQPRPRRQAEKPDGGKTVLLIILAIGLHVFAYVLLAWYIKFWPFNEPEKTVPETTSQETKPKHKTKREKAVSSLERPWQDSYFATDGDCPENTV